MNPEIKAKWVAALRSGEYSQGDGSLHAILGGEHRYCCLGVLCDLYAKEKGLEWVEFEHAEPGELVVDGTREWELTPLKVKEWAGLSSNDPDILYDEPPILESLSTMNDGGRPFEFIADKIEKYL